MLCIAYYRGLEIFLTQSSTSQISVCWSLTATVVLVFSMKSRKRGTEFGSVLDFIHKKRQFCRFRMSGNFSILHSLYTQLIRSWRFLKVIFLRARCWSSGNVAIVSLFLLPHNCVPYCKWGEWPSGLRRCDQNWKVPGSNPARRSARLRDPTSLRGSRWASGRICKNAVINIGWVRLSPR